MLEMDKVVTQLNDLYESWSSHQDVKESLLHRQKWTNRKYSSWCDLKQNDLFMCLYISLLLDQKVYAFIQDR